MRVPGVFRSRGTWLFLGLVALEFLLYDQWGSRRVTSVYPRWNDQVQYLNETYVAYENARAHGLAPALGQTLLNRSPQGTLHDFAALVAYTVAGPSRSAALALNFLALAAWQAAIFFATVRRTGTTGLALPAALLPLLLGGPWKDIPGSAYDFRLDHLAMCLLGVSAVLAWSTHEFQSRRGALWFGLSAGVTLLTRFLTGTYFVVIFALLLAWIFRRPDRRARIINLSLAALVAAIMATPVFWLNREALIDYYWVGHYIGPESGIRSSGLGWWGSIAFVGRHLLERHLGGAWIAVVLAGAMGLALCRGGKIATAPTGPAIPGVIFLIAPAIVLILHQQKSEVVVGALAAGSVLLAVALWVKAGGAASERAAGGFAVAMGVVAAGTFGRAQLSPSFSPEAAVHYRAVNALADDIFARTRAAGRNRLFVAVDHITDALDAQVLRVICYERHGVLLPIHMSLPTGVAAPEDGLVMTRLGESDFVFVTINDVTGPFPYDAALARLRPRVRTWCEENLERANEFTLGGRRMVLYQRR